ncbi:M23 family metallopeptidase [Nocardioides campestrisoli]|uniref:M23 family metallopeptidase n=1 Tax=Nocardioides campestrisoli TaxID=2736757 RepID=UPI0015E675EB|nr:M23 family metallopeptidase [Nocardioides campestrisoli]
MPPPLPPDLPGTLLASLLVLGGVLGTPDAPATPSVRADAPLTAGPRQAGQEGQEPTAEGRWPLAPRPVVAAPFAPPAQPWASGHRGVDLAGAVGQPVLAALPGRVTFAGRIAGKPVVVVRHGALRTTYEPVAGLLPPGARVDAGEQVGVLALPFSHCYPAACLHWGLRRGEEYLDPLTLVGVDRSVRLLPS